MNGLHVAVILGLLGVAQPACACTFADAQDALVHSAVPSPLPSDVVVLDVEMDTGDLNGLYRTGLRVRVRRVLQGDVNSSVVIVKTPEWTSCDDPFANGSSGLIIGYLIGEGSEQVLSPVFARRGDGFQIPGGGAVRPRYPLTERSVTIYP